MMQNAMVKSDFRATATHFVNIFVFLLIFEISGESSIVFAEYSAAKVPEIFQVILFFPHSKNFGLGRSRLGEFSGKYKLHINILA